MARVIVIDGPEKAGKTTFIQALTENLRLQDCRVNVRHWSNPDLKTFHSFAYTGPLADDFLSTEYDVVIWDRSFVSEFVYPMVMPQFQSSRRVFWNDPWLPEWLYGRSLLNRGYRLILLGPSVDILMELRDDTDHQCSVEMERIGYQYYGQRFGWDTIENSHNQSAISILVRRVIDRIQKQQFLYNPQGYCGPADAKVVFMGEALSINSQRKGQWLPFSSPYTTRLGREFGDFALEFGWTNADYVEEILGNQAGFEEKLVVACGRVAENCCKKWGFDYLPIKHPASGFRWGSWSEDYMRSLEGLKLELQRRDLYGN